jgi:hypothetical protein
MPEKSNRKLGTLLVLKVIVRKVTVLHSNVRRCSTDRRVPVSLQINAVSMLSF